MHPVGMAGTKGLMYEYAKGDDDPIAKEMGMYTSRVEVSWSIKGTEMSIAKNDPGAVKGDPAPADSDPSKMSFFSSLK